MRRTLTNRRRRARQRRKVRLSRTRVFILGGSVAIYRVRESRLGDHWRKVRHGKIKARLPMRRGCIYLGPLRRHPPAIVGPPDQTIAPESRTIYGTGRVFLGGEEVGEVKNIVVTKMEKPS